MPRPDLMLLLSVLSIACMSGCPASEPDTQPSAVTDPSRVSDPLAADSRPNAAVMYARLDGSMSAGFMEPLVDVNWDDPIRANSAAARFLEDNQDLIRATIEATEIEECDFDVDLKRGFDVSLPHLGRMRDLAQLLQKDANRFLHLSNSSYEVQERLVALIRLGVHSARDPMLIDKLVCMSILGLACESIVAWSERLPTDSRSAILVALEIARSKGLFEIKPVVEQELSAIREALQRGERFEYPNGGSFEVSPAERTEILTELERLHRAVETTWGNQEAERLIAAEMRSVTNPKARYFVLNWDKIHQQHARMEAQLTRAADALK